jgi:pimeloyl-ACP methyl ester carboxylesterase
MEQSGDIVILLHGIGRTGHSMRPLQRVLCRAGYEALAISYPWRRYNVDRLAAWVADHLETSAVWERFVRAHFVTHSMGGLIAHTVVEAHARPERIGRVVMLGPPNGGSEVADLLHRTPPYRWFYGPAGQDLTTMARAAGTPPSYALGVIAGDRGWPYLLGNLAIPKPHDGRVAVARTRLAGMADHIVVPTTHSFMPGSARVHRQVLHFLAQGRFDPNRP